MSGFDKRSKGTGYTEVTICSVPSVGPDVKIDQGGIYNTGEVD